MYVRKLQEWRPQFLAGYPSNIYVLARFMEREGVRVPLRAVFTSSEVLTPAERTVIERQFETQVWDRYGTGERLAVGQQCELRSYHQNVEFGVLEVADEVGVRVPLDTRGQLVQTSLTNFSMPLIRYAIEDMGYAMVDGCDCGRGLPLMGPVDGRKDDVIVTPDGRLMPRAGLDQIHEYAFGVERCQLVQHRADELVVRVLPRPEYSDADAAELVKQLQRRLGSQMHIQVELVDTLQLSVTGKERFIISELDPYRAEVRQ
jgi:phenylacetate-CoA ligase